MPKSFSVVAVLSSLLVACGAQTLAPIEVPTSEEVRVLFVLEGGAEVGSAATQLGNAVTSVTAGLSGQRVRFGMLGFHTSAQPLQTGFADAASFSAAIQSYLTFQQTGPISTRAALIAAHDLIDADLQALPAATREHTHYKVALVMFEADTSCDNPAYNPGIASDCAALAPSAAQCGACELSARTTSLRGVAGAASVTVVPVLVRDTPDATSSYLGSAIAQAAGRALETTAPASLSATLSGLNLDAL